jgi:ribosomal protein S18 acetylase RimI-like enzyme
MDKFEIREYLEADLPALALHWQESIKGWPPGFDLSSDTSPSAIGLWLRRSNSMHRWLGWLDGKIVGFMLFARYFNDPKVEYVGTFNVHPGYQGRGYGRKMLVMAIDKAIADKAKRLDLHTWAANTQAVPLYKKSGFFWRPRTGFVHMYNFMPVLLDNPIVREFLGESHWYDCLRQHLEVKEDSELTNGCLYHKYNFEKGGDTLEVLVDPSSSGIVGIASKDFSIRCDVPGMSHVAGLPQKVIWSLNSNQSNPVPVKISCDGATGIDYSFHKDFQFQGEQIFKTTLIPAPDLNPEKTDWYGKPIDCSIEIDTYKFAFRPGIKVSRPFSISTSPGPIHMIPGSEKEVVLNLDLGLEEDTVFSPEIKTSGNITLVGGSPKGSINIKPESSVGIPLLIKAGGSIDSGIISVGGSIKAGDCEAKIHPVNVHVGVSPTGRPVEIPDTAPGSTCVSNGLLYARIEAKGGGFNVYGQTTNLNLFNLYNEKIGEPLSNEFQGKEYDISVKCTELQADVLFKIESNDFPGIAIERRITIGSGFEINASIRVINHSDSAFTGLLRFSTGNWEGIRVIIPLKDRIITGTRDALLNGTAPFPTDPSNFPEPWFALATIDIISGERAFNGIIFKGAKLLDWDHRFPLSLEYSVNNLAPGESFDLPALKAITNAPSWLDIQKAALNGKPSKLSAKVWEHFHAESPLFTDMPDSQITFRLMRASCASGKAIIKTDTVNAIEISSDSWNLDNPFFIKLSDLPIKSKGLISLDYQLTANYLERSGKLPLLIPEPGSSINISTGREGEYDFFTVNNGCIEYRVAPNFHGSLYRLTENSNPNINLLKSAFPNPGMWTWISPWYGGIMHALRMYMPNHKFGFEGAPVNLNWAGYDWQGIKVTVTPLRRWQTLRLESFYLTRPGYPVVLNLLRFIETSSNKRSLSMEGLAFPCPSGNPASRTESILDEFKERTKVLPSEKGEDGAAGSWVAVYDPETRKTLGMVVNYGGVYLWDAAEDGQMVFWAAKIDTSPHEPFEFASMHVVTDNPELVPVLSDSFKSWGR